MHELEADGRVVFVVRLLVVLRAGLALFVLRILDKYSQVLCQLFQLLQVFAGACAGGFVAVVEELVGVPFDVLNTTRQLLILLHRVAQRLVQRRWPRYSSSVGR